MSDDYHSDYSSISKSMANTYMDSPQEYYLQYVSMEMPPRESTKAMEKGSIIHAALLDGMRLDQVAVAYPESCLKSNGAINPTPARQFEQDHPNHYHVKQEVYDELQACIDAVSGTVLSEAIEECHESERRHDALLNGIKCKCKPDLLGEVDGVMRIYDLKVCPPNPAHFIRASKRLRYWLQDAHYSAVISQETGKPTTFKFLAIEPTFPFRVHAYWYDARQREIARDAHIRLLERIAESHATGVWRDDWQHSLPLDSWDVGSQAEEAELVGFDDDE